MIRTITMTFEADEAALAKATAALFEVTPFGRCIEIATGDNPMCEAKRPDDRIHGSPELDQDAAKLLALGQDPGPTIRDFDAVFALLWGAAP